MGTPGSSVQEDWLARLSDERRAVYEAVAGEWEAAYAMLSVALNDAIAERAAARLVQARRHITIAGQLASRLTESLAAPLDALRPRGRADRSLPAVEALHPRHFRSEQAQQGAAWSYLVHWLPLGRRLSFLAKLSALRSVLHRTGAQFCEIAQEIGDGGSVDPEASWSALEVLHYDLNTAMRESVVVLKTYLSAASAGGFAAFRRQLARPHAPITAGAGLSGAST